MLQEVEGHQRGKAWGWDPMEKVSQQAQAVPCIDLWSPKHFLPSLGADQTDRLLVGEGDKSLKDDFKEHVSYLESQEFKQSRLVNPGITKSNQGMRGLSFLLSILHAMKTSNINLFPIRLGKKKNNLK